MMLLALIMVYMPYTYATAPYIESIQSVDTDSYLLRAKQMIQSSDYIGAKDQLSIFLSIKNILKSEQQIEEAEYLLAVVSYELGESQSISLLEHFLSSYPASQYAIDCRLKLGDYYFFNRRYDCSLKEYSLIDLSILNKTDFYVYTYRKAFSMIKVGNFELSRQLFNQLSSSDTYGVASQFYIAYLDYLSGDYDKALHGFRQVSTPSVSTSAIKGKQREYIPSGLEAGYYIAQIEFLQEKYTDVIKNGRSLLAKQPVDELIPEINRIIGESYYHLGDEESAGIFLSNYFANKEISHNHSSLYIMGVIEYNRGNYTEAIEYFIPLKEEISSRGQSANLYLGQCAMLHKNYNGATIYFEKAYEIGYDKKVNETALYNYAVARIEGGNIPFGSSTDILEDFSKTFPTSQYAPIVDEYLAVAYYNDKAYEQSLDKLNRIENPSKNVLQTKQIILYELGIETYLNGDYQKAIDYLTEASLMTGYNADLATQALLWLGDTYYAQKNYSMAEQQYQQFINRAKYNDLNRHLAFYNLGYSQYQTNKFKDARRSFEQSIITSSTLNKKMHTDAIIRIADCDYYLGDFSKARSGYAIVMSNDSEHADYAAMQHANMQGLLKNDDAKITELNAMIAEYPQSIWLPTAMLEKAQTYVGINNLQAAISTYDALIEKYPHSTDAREGLLQKAIILSNSGESQQAEQAYKEVIMRWPSSEQAEAANDDLRRIYASRGELEDYAAFLHSIPNAPQLNKDQMERLIFEAAENDIANDGNISKMENYITQYPHGQFLANALYYLANHHYSNNEQEQALRYIDELLVKRPDSQFISDALLHKAIILENPSIGSAQAALTTYRLLEQRGDSYYMKDAYAGIMRNTDSATEQLEYADKLSNFPSLSSDEIDEIAFYRGNALISIGKIDEGIAEYERLAENTKSKYGSIASVELGNYYLTIAEYDKAEKILTDFTNNGTPYHQYWLARGFIALADVYHAKGDKELAIEYIKSLNDNYPGKEEDIFNMINHRLNNWEK